MPIFKINRLAMGKSPSPGFLPKNKLMLRHERQRLRKIKAARIQPEPFVGRAIQPAADF